MIITSVVENAVQAQKYLDFGVDLIEYSAWMSHFAPKICAIQFIRYNIID